MGIFKKLLEGNKNVWNKIGSYIDALDEFDSYRTPEIHGAGRARNQTIFATGKFLEDKYHKKLLDNYVNKLTDFTNVFGQLLNYAKYKDEKFLTMSQMLIGT